MIIDFVNERIDYTILLTGGLKNNKVFKFDEKEYKYVYFLFSKINCNIIFRFDELNLKNNKEAIEKMKHMDDIFMEADDEDFDESEELTKISDKMSETKLDGEAIDKKMNDVEEVIPASVQKKVKNVPAPVQQKVNNVSAPVQQKANDVPQPVQQKANDVQQPVQQKANDVPQPVKQKVNDEVLSNPLPSNYYVAKINKKI
jgi:hypothetical protein